MTDDATIKFIEDQIEAVQPQIKQAKIMLIAWQAGGELFKENAEKTATQLGSLTAVSDSLKAQLEALKVK